MRSVVLPTRLLIAPCLATAQAASSPVEIARSYTIDSKILGEQRTIDVTLPDGYARDSAQRYPVIFALDGEFEGHIASTIATFYAGTLGMDSTRDVDASPDSARGRALSRQVAPRRWLRRSRRRDSRVGRHDRRA